MYDYINQQITVFNPEKAALSDNLKYPFAYVYSLRDKSWGLRLSNLLYTVNAYPETWAVCKDSNANKIVNFSNVNTGTTAVKGLLVTRPLKLEGKDQLKTIQSIIQRGKFNFSDTTRSVKPVRSILYGSRDLYNWNLIWSSTDHYLRGFSGTPYKFFRIVLLCDLKPGESLYGCSILYEPKLTAKLR